MRNSINQAHLDIKVLKKSRLPSKIGAMLKTMDEEERTSPNPCRRSKLGDKNRKFSVLISFRHCIYI